MFSLGANDRICVLHRVTDSEAEVLVLRLQRKYQLDEWSVFADRNVQGKRTGGGRTHAPPCSRQPSQPDPRCRDDPFSCCIAPLPVTSSQKSIWVSGCICGCGENGSAASRRARGICTAETWSPGSPPGTRTPTAGSWAGTGTCRRRGGSPFWWSLLQWCVSVHLRQNTA